MWQEMGTTKLNHQFRKIKVIAALNSILRNISSIIHISEFPVNIRHIFL